MKKTIPDFEKMKQAGEKISMLTAYDYPSAKLVEDAGVDTILVGDSLGMVVLGYDSTVPVTMEDMLHHTKAVRRGAAKTFVIADMPFMSYATLDLAIINAGRLIKEGGADAIKLEGGLNLVPIVESLTRAGIPVVGHIGLTPQTANQLGGFKVQGRDLESAVQLVKDSQALEQAGVFLLVLEAIPRQVAAQISTGLKIPTIGIGAGLDCDGQVLVFHDLLGLFERFKPKFVKQFAQLGQEAVQSIHKYHEEVKFSLFPADEHTFGLSDEVIQKLYGDK
ncbi:3-methyl-2-oxobutanoate hydroxymethyltransferase [Desulfosporosinus sp. BICA1-9]|uniref:3-methyl-2-oxobutanoate hydroxymethyltransferase n=2 Tax=Desulfosporosinus sp. BICA1-9 TaxID=1531958 RepID=UPI00054C52BD|nr:3-methyl-2-oxobutanoate hydroxymethyltransferase [Desulfosporosinus sp. BICA1-9]KJS49086.1 MAG: 3-methyl-2-oxobutanoate hydroxymethyltransferase [Peptococcaceae bacterium BRH_c23]KJS88881.1 MAG: 3-methyl-2-oxobutanoate hydroxymethyltransferase [Desulfosporosinus sp. BICA1-9]HBW36676.1 3-methyl-2-oxobutanoate hydroxymethyltransferase [Desulfosporosinus sp.]